VAEGSVEGRGQAGFWMSPQMCTEDGANRGAVHPGV